MIPKKIHFCWLGGGKYPERVRQCMESWRRALPGYEIVRWDESRFDVNSVPWVREAIERKKYAFAADYIRHYALYHEGGIYLDTDVEVLKPFDDLLDAEMFAVIETEESVLARNIAQDHARPAGLKYKDVAQELDEGIRIHPSPTIAAYAAKAVPESYAIHHCLGSWRPAAPCRKKKWYSRWWKSLMRGLGLHK